MKKTLTWKNGAKSLQWTILRPSMFCSREKALYRIYIPLLLSNIKHVSWNYEKEYRCTMASNAPGPPYVAANPKEIFVGLKCSDKNAMKLQEIGDKLGIPVHRMEFDEISPSYKLSIT